MDFKKFITDLAAIYGIYPTAGHAMADGGHCIGQVEPKGGAQGPAMLKGMRPAERRDTKPAVLIGTRPATIRATTKASQMGLEAKTPPEPEPPPPKLKS